MAELSLTELWHACGGDGPLRVLVEHPSQPPRDVVVPTPFALLGSSDSGAVVLADEQVSRRHACVQLIDGRPWCFDMVSRTGTYWGDRRRSAGLLDQPIRIGPYRIRLQETASTSALTSPFKPLPPGHDALPAATLEFLNAHRAGSVEMPIFQLDRPLILVGQSPRCKIRFSCPTVSTCHCSLLRTPHGIWVIDLQSREGVSVNGTKVRWARLRDGDCLGIGRFEVMVRLLPRRPEQGETASLVNLATDQRPADQRPALVSLSDSMDAALPVSNRPSIQPSSFGPIAARIPDNSALLPAGLLSAGLLSAGPLSAGPPTAGDAAQPLVVTLVNQFSMMQQQMFDQFQQTTMMMLQMFGTLQRDQLQLVRQELESLRELNREIVALQAELAKHPREARRADPSPAPDREPTAAAPRLSERRSGPSDVEAAAPTPAPASPPKAAPPKAAPPKAAPCKAAASHPGSVASGAFTDGAGDDVHAWLSQRFNQLQHESKSRWQKLLATVVGG
ncbi:MAG: FHA domain-containing protein [Gemmataceae bacterium]|nr:FHA domain-containing protein [Gemmataceae bacterium]